MDVKRVVKIVTQIRSLTDELIAAIEEDREKTLQNMQLPSRSPEEIAKMVQSRLCLRCGQPLGDTRETRGTHEKCYAKLRRDNMIEHAELAGYCLPRGKPGTPSEPSFPIAQRIAETKAKLTKAKSNKKKP